MGLGRNINNNLNSHIAPKILYNLGKRMVRNIKYGMEHQKKTGELRTIKGITYRQSAVGEYSAVTPRALDKPHLVDTLGFKVRGRTLIVGYGSLANKTHKYSNRQESLRNNLLMGYKKSIGHKKGLVENYRIKYGAGT